MNGSVYCQFCKGDPFEYVTLEGEKIAVAITCCESAITQYYQGLTTISPDANGDQKALDSLRDW